MRQDSDTGAAPPGDSDVRATAREPDVVQAPDGASLPSPASEGARSIWWGWPLRICSQFLPLIYSQWGYTCMQLVECRVPASAAERRTVHLVLAIMVAVGVEIVLLFARLLDDPPPSETGPRRD